EVPSELPKVSLVNASLKKLKFHLTQFDSMVKKRTTPDARTEDVLLTVMNSMSLIGESVNMDKNRKESCNKCFNLEAELLKSQNAFNDLLKSTICKLKDIIKSMREKSKEENGNYDYGEIETKNVELENSVAKLISENKRLCNEINHVKQVFKEQSDSIKKTPVHTKEQIKQAKAERPLDKELDFSCKHAQRIQELLVYVRDICPNAINLSATKVYVTPKNKVKKVRFAEPLTSSSNIKQVESLKTSDSNTPVLSSTGLKCSTSKCGLKPTCNKKNDRITLPSSRNMKNKV
ncbi:hypothetical protein Tco_1479319, partial [Tanacetum coccineum]